MVVRGRFWLHQLSNCELFEILCTPSFRAQVDYEDASGPLWVSRIGKEDSALSIVKRRN